MAIGTFGAFTQARLGIYSATIGLNVTGNNITNINTVGYTRQRPQQVSLYAAGSDRYYSQGDVRVGCGPLVKTLSQIRSPYLDIRYRTENAKVGYYDATMEGLDQVASILDEVGKGDASKDEDGFGILGLQFSKLAAALKDLVSETGHQEFDTSVRQIADNIVTTLNRYASDLEEVREITLAKLEGNVSTINERLANIRSLNEEIRKCDIHGDPALELRDKRNVEIDELSKLIDIDVTYGEEVVSAGLKVERLTIKLDNANPDGFVTTDESLLVDGLFAAQISLDKIPAVRDIDPDDPTTLPFWNDTDNKAVATEAEATMVGGVPKPNPGYLPYTTDDGKLTADPDEATLEYHPNYNVTISELTNKKGDLYIGTKTYAEKPIDAADLPAGLTWNSKTNKATSEQEDLPSDGDKTVTIYTRTLKPGTTNKPPLATDYNYTRQVIERVLTKPVHLDDNDLNGELQANRELLTEEGEFTDLDVITNIDEGAGSKRGIPYYQRSLDLLAKTFANVLNEANQGFLMNGDTGEYITKGTDPETGKEIGVPVTVSANGKTHNLSKNDTWDQLDADIQGELQTATGLTYQKEADGTDNFKEIVDAYLKGQVYVNGEPTIEEEDLVSRGIFMGGVLFSNHPNSDDPTGITAANISVSKLWQHSNQLLVRDFNCVPGEFEPAPGASENIRHLEYLVTFQKFGYIPSTAEGCEGASDKAMFEGTFHEMWNNIGDVLGEDRSYLGSELDNSYQIALSIDVERDSVSSVDFNDEAMNLMMYAKSYNAACRLMTTIDSVLDKLINNTGMTT